MGPFFGFPCQFPGGYTARISFWVSYSDKPCQVRLYSDTEGWSNPAPYQLWIPLNVSSVEANDNTVATDASEEPWVLVMKLSDGGILGYDSELWGNVELLNPDSPEGEPMNAKYQAFLDVPFTRLRACVAGLLSRNLISLTILRQPY